MSATERHFSTLLVVCIVGFIGGLLLSYITLWGVLLSLASLVLGMLSFFVFYAGHKIVQTRVASMPMKRYAAKVHSRWRTHHGKVIGPEEIVPDPISYHVVLITDDNRRLECTTHFVVFQQRLEGSWGYAEVQGEWLGSYGRDADLYTKHTQRR